MRLDPTDPVAIVIYAVAFAIVMLVATKVSRHRALRRELARIRETWGQPLRSYREHRPIDARDRDAKVRADEDRLDDATAADLELTRVFHRIDRTLTGIGAQTLYRWLRRPLVDPAALADRGALVDAVMHDDARRVALTSALARLSDREGWEASAAITSQLPTIRAPLWLLRVLPFAMVGALAGAVLASSLPLLLVGLALALALPAIHYLSDRVIGYHLEALADLRRVVTAAIELRKIAPDLVDLGEHTARLGALRRALGGGSRTGAGALAQLTGAAGDYANAFRLRQLITYGRATQAIARWRDGYERVLDRVGGIDAALCVAYLRAHDAELAPARVDPDARTLEASDLRHPLVASAVGNDLALGPKGLLVTGSNMGGKSTLLRATGLAAVLAQSIGLVAAAAYRAPALRVVSLMHVQDDPIAGLSLFRAEVDRIHALVRSAEGGRGHLFLLDETFRGTNPTERIAASAAVLRWLARDDLVIAATHDRELCELLSDAFALAYFSEQVEGEDVVFDYRLRPGVLERTNAIALLERAGYPTAIVQEARRIVSAGEADRGREAPDRASRALAGAEPAGPGSPPVRG